MGRAFERSNSAAKSLGGIRTTLHSAGWPNLQQQKLDSNISLTTKIEPTLPETTPELSTTNSHETYAVLVSLLMLMFRELLMFMSRVVSAKTRH